MSHDYDALRSLEARMAAQEQKLSAISSDVQVLKGSMDQNTEALKEYIELSKKLKVGLGFLAVIEKCAAWCTKVGMFVVLIWGTWKYIVQQSIQK